MNLISKAVFFLSLVLTSLCLSLYGQESADLEVREDTITGTDVTFKLVHIPAGSFMMGSPDSEMKREADEGPQKEVKVEAFWMGMYEVTFDEYDIFRDRERIRISPMQTEESTKQMAPLAPVLPMKILLLGWGNMDFLRVP